MAVKADYFGGRIPRHFHPWTASYIRVLDLQCREARVFHYVTEPMRETALAMMHASRGGSQPHREVYP